MEPDEGTPRGRKALCVLKPVSVCKCVSVRMRVCLRVHVLLCVCACPGPQDKPLPRWLLLSLTTRAPSGVTGLGSARPAPDFTRTGPR